MAKIEIYSRSTCPYCIRAKGLLQNKGQKWEEIDLGISPERTDEMIQRAGGRHTVPEIFIDNELIGGYDELAALEAAGKLDALLAN